MPSAYPAGLDSFITSRSDATVMATNQALDHNNYADAINKIEAELGVNFSGKRLDNFFNPKGKPYNAVGGGVGNQSAAVQAAIADAAAVKGTVLITDWFRCLDPLTVPAGKAVNVLAVSKTGAGLLWGGTQQAFLKFPGGNQGSTLRGLSIMGALADPCVQILAVGGSGSNGYNSLVTVDDCWIGFGYDGATAFPSATHKSYSGIEVECDVFHMSNFAVWGRNYAVKLKRGTTDAYLFNGSISSLPEGGEARGIGLWCNDESPYYFEGRLHEVNVNVASGAECAALYRSSCDLVAHYCESSILPIKAKTAVLNIIGGKIGTDNPSAQYLIDADGSSGSISYPHIAVGGATGLLKLIRTTNSPVTKAWEVNLRNKALIPGTPPADPLAIDQPSPPIRFPGYTGRTALTYGTTIATDALQSGPFTIVATNGTAFTISNPTNAFDGMEITYDIKNSSGGAMGAITWGAAFKLAGAFVNPANGLRRTISFYYDGTNWVETNRAAADI